MGNPRKKEGYKRGGTVAEELNLERSDFVFDRQPDAFRSGRVHQWLSGDLTGEKVLTHNYFAFLVGDEILRVMREMCVCV